MPDSLDSTDTLSPREIAAANPGGIPQAVDAPGGNIVNMLDDDHKKRETFIKESTEAQQREIGAQSLLNAQEERRSDAYRSRMERAIDREGASAEEFKPWNADQELASRKTNLWDQFGSPGFVISMLASAFTAYPMNSALNAGAAAMNAINQGDMKSYELAHQAWKDNADLTVKRLNLEHQQVADIANLQRTNLAEWQRRSELIALQYGDERKLALLRAGKVEDYEKAREAEIKSAQDLAAANNAITENYALMSTLNGHVAQPGEPVTHKDAKGTPMAGGDERWYKQTDPMAAYSAAYKQLQEAKYSGRFGSLGVMDKVQEKQHIRDGVKRDHPDWPPDKVDLETERRIKESQAAPLTGNRREQLQAHIGQYDLAINDLIPSIESVLNKYVGAAGGAGRINRLAERVSDLLGSNKTDRVQFMRDVSELRLMATRLLLDQSTGKPLSVEAGDVAAVVAGLDIGDTTANTLRAMEELRGRLTKLRNGVADRLRGSGGEGAQLPVESQPAAKSGGWDSFPAVH